MATMYPPFYPGEGNPDNPEFNVYQTLKTLPDRYTVFYSKKFKGTGSWKEEGEVDFVIFDGVKSLLCMEVKGGIISFDGVADAWLQNGKVLKTQPDTQATDGMRALMKFLDSDVRELNCGWVLGFPHCSLPESFQPPTRIPKSVIIDQASFLDIEKSIAITEKYYYHHYKKNGIDPAAALRIRSGLTRSVEFIQKTGVRVADDSQQLMRVTEDQFRILEDLEVNSRIAIKGYAGTGKTALAAEFARRLGENGQKTLFLFFNKMVASHTSRSFDRELPITCTTFHSFAKRLIEAEEKEWWQRNSQRTNPDFWETEVPLKLLEITPDFQSKFDAIIVDEGQDFKPEWFEYLNTLLLDPGHGRFVVFYDEDQDLFGRWNELPWGGEGITRKFLRENCRNTREIVSFLNEKNPTNMSPCSFSPQGEAVIERTLDSASDARAHFEKDVIALLKQGILPGQIVVLLDRHKNESCVADLKKIGRIKFQSIDRRYDGQGNAVSFTNINVFKGMETDIAFLFFHGPDEQNKVDKQVYVSGSRARTVLYIYWIK